MKYRIKNWSDYQHYKDRCPPWLKLHASMLSSEVWVMGNDATRALLIACMMLASRNSQNDGSFNGDPEYIKRFAYLNTKPDFKPLIEYGFIELLHDASDVLAKCNTEKSREETEKRQSREEEILASLGIVGQVALDFIQLRKLKKSAITETSMKGISREAAKVNLTLLEAITIMCERGWAGFKAEWLKEKTLNVQDARLDTARQIFGGLNGHDNKIIDITPTEPNKGNRKAISEFNDGIRQPDAQ